MRYLSEHQAARIMGLGHDIGDLYQDLDGYLYEWVEGVDEWGDPVGFLRGLSEPEIAELSGLGALYEAPDGTIFQAQGMEEEEENPMEAMDSGAQGQRRLPAPRPQRLRPGIKGRPRRKKGGFLKKLLPVAKFAAGLVPGAGAALRAGIDVAEKALKKPAVAGYDGFGALYAAEDGTVYQVQGAEELNGLYADEELRGFAEDDELRGLDDDEDDELRGFAEDEELRGFDEDQDMHGFDGYVRQDATSGLERFEPAVPPQTHWHVASNQPPEVWKPLW